MNDKNDEQGEHAEGMLIETEDTVLVPTTGNELLMELIKKDAPMEMIEKFMDLRDREEAKNAKRAFVQAMAAFKKDPPEILKTAHVSYLNSKNQTVEWDHAELGKICEAINAGLSEYDLFSKWGLQQPDPNTVVVTCTVTHSEGHSESVTMQAPPDKSGGKDELMAVQSTNTRLQRITLLAVTGIAAKGMDKETPTNGMTGAAVEFITEDQVKTLSSLVTEAKLNDKDITRFLAVLEVEDVATIPQSKYIEAVDLLKKAVKALKVREAKKKKEGTE